MRDAQPQQPYCRARVVGLESKRRHHVNDRMAADDQVVAAAGSHAINYTRSNVRALCKWMFANAFAASKMQVDVGVLQTHYQSSASKQQL